MKFSLKIFFIFLALSAEAQHSALRDADSLYQIGKYQEAIQLYQQESLLTSKIHQKIAQAQEARGNLSKAILHYKKALALDKKLVIAAARYGKLLYRTKNYKRSDSLFAELIKRFSTNPDFYYQRGLNNEKLKNKNAQNYFYKVLNYDATHQKALYKIAVNQFKSKKYNVVDSLSLIALTENPDNRKMLSLRAQNFYMQRKYKDAISVFEKLREKGERSEFLFEKLGYSYYQLTNYKKAVDRFIEVIKINPDNAKVHLQLGKLYNLLENYKEAEKHLLMALLLSKTPLDEHYQSLGLTYKMQKDYKKAINYFKLALAENPKKIRSQFELAVAADNYYKELKTRLNYYELFLKKFKKHPKAEVYTILAERRAQDLKKEIHFSDSKTD